MKSQTDPATDCKHEERGDDLCWYCEEGIFNDGSECDYCHGTGTIEVCDDCGKQLTLEREEWRRLKADYDAKAEALQAMTAQHEEELKRLRREHARATAPVRQALYDARDRLHDAEDRIQSLLNQQWATDFPRDAETGTLAVIAEACTRFGINLGRRPATQKPRTMYVHPTTYTFAAAFVNPGETIYMSWDRNTQEVVGWLRVKSSYKTCHLDGEKFNLSKTWFDDYMAGNRTALQVYLHKLANRQQDAKEGKP